MEDNKETFEYRSKIKAKSQTRALKSDLVARPTRFRSGNLEVKGFFCLLKKKKTMKIQSCP